VYTTTCPPEVKPLAMPDVMLENPVAARVRGLLAGFFSRDRGLDRRRDRRYPYPHLIRLLPVAADGITPAGPAFVAVGKHLSERGLGFYHVEPLPYRRMIATLESVQGGHLSLLVDLNWCRFTEQGWYESGGRFLEVVDSPG
jgi:hypothetical protein